MLLTIDGVDVDVDVPDGLDLKDKETIAEVHKMGVAKIAAEKRTPLSGGALVKDSFRGLGRGAIEGAAGLLSFPQDIVGAMTATEKNPTGYDIPFFPSNEEVVGVVPEAIVPDPPKSSLGQKFRTFGSLVGGSVFGPGVGLAKNLAVQGAKHASKKVMVDLLKGAAKRSAENAGVGAVSIAGSEGAALAGTKSGAFKEGSKGDILTRIFSGMVAGKFGGTGLARKKTTGSFFKRGPSRKQRKEMRRLFENMTEDELNQMLRAQVDAPELFPIDFIKDVGTKSELAAHVQSGASSSTRAARNLTNRVMDRDIRAAKGVRGVVQRLTGIDTSDSNFSIRTANQHVRDAARAYMKGAISKVKQSGNDASDRFDMIINRMGTALAEGKKTYSGRMEIERLLLSKTLMEQRSNAVNLMFRHGLKKSVDSSRVDAMQTYIDKQLLNSGAHGTETLNLLNAAKQALAQPMKTRMPLAQFLDDYQLHDENRIGVVPVLNNRRDVNVLTGVKFKQTRKSKGQPGDLKSARQVADKLGPQERAVLQQGKKTQADVEFVESDAQLRRDIKDLGFELSPDGRFVNMSNPDVATSSAGKLYSLMRMMRGKLDKLEGDDPSQFTEAKGVVGDVLRQMDDILRDRVNKTTWVDGPDGPVEYVKTIDNNKILAEALDNFSAHSDAITAELALFDKNKISTLTKMQDRVGDEIVRTRRAKSDANENLKDATRHVEENAVEMKRASMLTDENIHGLMQILGESNTPAETAAFLRNLRLIDQTAPAKLLASVFSMKWLKADGTKVGKVRKGGGDAPQFDGPTFFKEVFGDQRSRDNLTAMIESVAESYGKDPRVVGAGFKRFMDIISRQTELRATSGTTPQGHRIPFNIQGVAIEIMKTTNTLAKKRDASFLIDLATSERGLSLMRELAGGGKKLGAVRSRGKISGRQEIVQQMLNISRQSKTADQPEMFFTMTQNEDGGVSKSSNLAYGQ